MSSQSSVISRENIPVIKTVEVNNEVHNLGELRDFRWSDQLRAFMPEAKEISVSWVKLDQGEALAPHLHPIQSMMIVYSGSGQLTGDLCRSIAKDDVVVVPAGCAHGFVGGPGGLWALSIQFGEGLYTRPEKARVVFVEDVQTLPALATYAAERLSTFSRGAIFSLLDDGTLSAPVGRAFFLDAIRLLLARYDSLLIARQATCRDEKFESAFRSHLRARASLQAIVSVNVPGRRDSVLEAFLDWFSHQMYVLDNAEKAAITYLVLEPAAQAYWRHGEGLLAQHLGHKPASPAIGGSQSLATYLELLRNESAETYGRLRQIVQEAWDMLEAMTDRLVQLTRAV
jgi:quercetin dioxygenase-like cupin family protein